MKLSDLPARCAEQVSQLSDADVQALLDELPGWRLAQGALERRSNFADFHQTMAFVNAVAEIAHAQDHHPDLHVSYGRCVLRFNTHSVNGISVNDFICAREVNELLERIKPLPAPR
jgi:4a-hydroxytetrahydrobiopterin dehydratase